ncbi:MAG: glycosyltransferase family 4 protein [Candidatus Chisholmbacteria bacterium]|nr:glycosyltransferase family 4 protein [Candidatus Chisholmbacteria bacterium]
MRIAIDARLFGLEHTGIGRYVKKLVEGISSSDSPHDFIFFVRPPHHHEIKSTQKCQVVVADIGHYTLKEQFVLPKLITREHVDLVHFPHFNVPFLYRAPFIVTIHDLLWHNVLGFSVTTLDPLRYAVKYLGYRLVVRHAVSTAEKIIVPSLWVKKELEERFKLPDEKTVVTSEGVDRNFSGNLPSLLQPEITQPYLVYTGSLYPHKNVLTLLKALSLINQKLTPKMTLVLVSTRSIFTAKILAEAKSLGLSAWVKHLGFLEDTSLASLYSQSLAVIEPSTSEGFGLTGLEAMAASCPVIAARATALPEIYGHAALFFEPKNHEELAAQIQSLLKDPRQRLKLIKLGRAQAQKYTWEKMVNATLRVYDEVVGTNREQ